MKVPLWKVKDGGIEVTEEEEAVLLERVSEIENHIAEDHEFLRDIRKEVATLKKLGFLILFEVILALIGVLAK